jgi:Fe-S-cluster-containing dehydrogenase component
MGKKSRKNMSAKLIIDLSRMKPQGQAAIRCSYKHHPENKGFDAVLEMVRFSLICRRCESAPCVAACPRKALEKVPDGMDGGGVLKRAHMLCTGCGTCAIACPFGTVYDDLMPFASSVCDVCKGRLEPDEKPLCVRTCQDGSLDYGDAEPRGDLVEVIEGVLVRVAEGSTWRPFLKDKQEARK